MHASYNSTLFLSLGYDILLHVCLVNFVIGLRILFTYSGHKIRVCVCKSSYIKYVLTKMNFLLYLVQKF